jgi:pyruvate dehydrogenase E2 component (dihydrolipoamide acetyltransferase)
MSNLRAFTMPKWGIEMTEGALAEWLIAEGQAFVAGQVLASIETDKIVNEVEADYAAVCLRLIAEPDNDYPVGALLAVFGEPNTASNQIDEFVAGFVASGDYENQDSNQTAETIIENRPETDESAISGSELVADLNIVKATLDPASPEPQPEVFEVPKDLYISAKAASIAARNPIDFSTLDGSGNKGRILLQDVAQHLNLGSGDPETGPAIDNKFAANDHALSSITPIALKVVQGNNIDLSGISGSGKNQRIRLRDLSNSLSKGVEEATPRTKPGEVITVPFSRMRNHIAERLTKSHNEIPHYFLEIDVDVDALEKERANFNANAKTPATINDVVLLATARTLAKHPQVNINVGDKQVLQYADINLAIAVSIDDGLIAPVIKKADALSLSQISKEAKRLISGAREGKLSLPEYGHGTFTVSNLGMHGIKRFTSIINPPQAAILSVGQFHRAPIETLDGFDFRWKLSLTMACDHRVIDGTTGTSMLESLKALLEAPKPLFD